MITGSLLKVESIAECSKTKDLMITGSLMKVESIAECSQNKGLHDNW